ncbi:hypothetical protein Tco_0591750 [Tanacetum coccineum]
MASMNTRSNIKKLDGNIVQKHGDSKQGAQGNREAEVFQVSNDDTAVAQRRFVKASNSEEKTNTYCLVEGAEKRNIRRVEIKVGFIAEEGLVNGGERDTLVLREQGSPVVLVT